MTPHPGPGRAAPPITVTPHGPDTPDTAGAEVLDSSAAGTTTTGATGATARPPAEWDHFAPAPDRPPGAVARWAPRTAGVRRVLAHEWTVVVLAAVVLAAALNWRTLLDPARTLPRDAWDPSLVAYLIAWGGHALTHDPANLWHLNAFYPSPFGLAYTDSMLGYAPLAVLGTGVEAAVLRYNIIFILAQALALVGAYALARQLGVGRIGAGVAGVAFAMAPWRLAQAGHLHILSTGGIALALAFLARGHGVRWRRAPGEEPCPRPGWAFGGWLVAAWQVTIGFGIGLVFVYVLLGAVVAGCVTWAIRRRRLPPSRLLLADGAGAAVFAALTLFMAQPYMRVLDLFPFARRDAAWVALYSPPLRGYLTAPAESLIWGDLHATSRHQLSVPGEMALLPGFALYALAASGLIFSVWSLWVRLALLAGVAATVVLGLGTQGPAGGRIGYLILLDGLPGFEGLRTPGRLIVWTTLCLALLAAGGVCALADRAAEAAQWRGLPRPVTAARLALLLPLLLVLVEGLGTIPQASVPTAPATLATVPAPYLVLPSDSQHDIHVMLWSTDRFADVVNGGGDLTPVDLARTRGEVARFPDRASVAYLRQLGVRAVVVRMDLAAGTPWANAATEPIGGMGITRETADGAVVFRL
jgi:hypothetical protein